MKIQYHPNDINNFHNSAPITLIIKGAAHESAMGRGMVYDITTGQARRIRNHFCGISGCQCAAGAAIEAGWDRDGRPNQFEIYVKYCESE